MWITRQYIVKYFEKFSYTYECTYKLQQNSFGNCHMIMMQMCILMWVCLRIVWEVPSDSKSKLFGGNLDSCVVFKSKTYWRSTDRSRTVRLVGRTIDVVMWGYSADLLVVFSVPTSSAKMFHINFMQRCPDRGSVVNRV